MKETLPKEIEVYRGTDGWHVRWLAHGYERVDRTFLVTRGNEEKARRKAHAFAEKLENLA